MRAYQKEVLRRQIPAVAAAQKVLRDESSGFRHTPDPLLPKEDIPAFERWPAGFARFHEQHPLVPTRTGGEMGLCPNYMAGFTNLEISIHGFERGDNRQKQQIRGSEGQVDVGMRLERIGDSRERLLLILVDRKTSHGFDLFAVGFEGIPATVPTVNGVDIAEIANRNHRLVFRTGFESLFRQECDSIAGDRVIIRHDRCGAGGGFSRRAIKQYDRNGGAVHSRATNVCTCSNSRLASPSAMDCNMRAQRRSISAARAFRLATQYSVCSISKATPIVTCLVRE
jgi:hypothetical protein